MSHERRRTSRPSPEETHPDPREQDEEEQEQEQELSDSDTHARSPRPPFVRPANPTPSSSASNSTSTLGSTVDVSMSSSPPPTLQDSIDATGDRTSVLAASTVTGHSRASGASSSVGVATTTPLWPSASDLSRNAVSTVSPVRHYPQLHLRTARQQQNLNHPRLPLPDREDSVSRPRSITFGTLKKASLGASGASSSTTGASGKKSRMAVLPSYLRQTTFMQHFQPEGTQPDPNTSSSGRESTKRRRLSGRRHHANTEQYEDSGSDSSVSSDSSSGSESGSSAPENDSGTSTPTPDHKPLRYQLPSRWSSTDKTDKTDLLEDDLQVFYTGPGKEDRDASAIRANRPIPPQCGVYYYEVNIKSKGQSGYIGVGVCNSTVALDRLPGWEPQSWGYHGDDGNSFGGCGNGRPFGPVFTTGDTVGCGVNFRDMSLFYTKNGTYLGVAFRDLKGPLYPTVGMRTIGEIVEANFGQREFVFDIERHVKEEKIEAWQSLENTLQKAVAENNQVNTLSQSLGQLVLSYMIHHGYSESARQFSSDLNPSQGEKKKGSSKGHLGLTNGADCPAAVLDAERRKVIRSSIMAGHIDKALELLEIHYPGVLTSNEDLLLQLRCRKFVEMVSSASSPLRALDNLERKNNIGNGKRAVDVEMKDRTVDSMDVDMEDSKSEETEEVKDELEGLGLLKDAIQYGQFLQKQYKTARRPSVQDMLIDAFSVLAYAEAPDEGAPTVVEAASKTNGSNGGNNESHRHPSHHPRTSQHPHHNHGHNHHPHKQPHHYHHSHHHSRPISRERVATTVNTAILVSQNLPKTAPLETVFRQATVSLSELTRQGCGEAAFFDLEHDCFE